MMGANQVESAAKDGRINRVKGCIEDDATSQLRRSRVASVSPGWAGENRAQGTVEYALTLFALLAMVAGAAALWRAGANGVFTDVAQQAASHALDGEGAVDISLY